MKKIIETGNKIVNNKYIEDKNSSLKLIPKFELYMQYMLKVVLIQLPRIEKFSIGTEYKTLMYDTLRNILLVDKIETNKKLPYLNKIDADLNTQRILLRIMREMNWIDNKRFNYVMIELIGEIISIEGQITGNMEIEIRAVI